MNYDEYVLTEEEKNRIKYNVAALRNEIG